jgi:hypothetical protein
MTALATAAPAIAAGQPDSFRRTLPDPATRLADPDHD